MYLGISEKVGNLGLPYILVVDFILGFILPHFQKVGYQDYVHC